MRENVTKWINVAHCKTALLRDVRQMPATLVDRETSNFGIWFAHHVFFVVFTSACFGVLICDHSDLKLSDISQFNRRGAILCKA